jgi:hypothetical protein
VQPLFPSWSNSIYRWTIAIAIIGAISIPCAAMSWARSPYATGESTPIVQPIKFDHRHHVRDDGIDCLYCHGAAKRTAYAGIPSISICMGCHNQIWNASPELTQLRNAANANAELTWTRVNSLPRHVFFNHSVHIAKGVGCVTCHGRVDDMAAVYQDKPLSMDWCVDCHRDPESRLRPKDKITDMEWSPSSEEQRVIGATVRKELHVHPTTDCSGCHR